MFQLLPQPRDIQLKGGTFHFPETGYITLDIPRAADFLFTVQHLQTALVDEARIHLEITGSGHVPFVVRLTLHPGFQQPQSYRLIIEEDRVEVVGHDAAGVFYGVATLIQLVQVYGRDLPQLIINDYPDFPVRGVMLDISRDKVPTMETLYGLVDMLAGWKINQFQLYMEHTFAYHGHEQVWKDASPITPAEILALDAYCRERFVELVPNQNSFGHMHRWLMHSDYKYLAETEPGAPTPWGTTFEHPFSLSPAAPETLDFLEGLYDQLLPNFSSKQFNVGADETFDLGLGRSKAEVEAKGKGRVYLDFLLEIYQRVKARGYTMQFWGDIINQYPELVPHLPKDVIALEWGYEADHDFPAKTRLFAEAGISYYVCPGTSSWNTIAGRTDNAIANIRSAVENGLKNGAMGVLNTDWGDHGHWQPLPVSYLGFAYGAGISWAYEQNREMNLPAVLDAFAFRDYAGVMGKLVYDLGNAYQQSRILLHNSSILFWLYHNKMEKLKSGPPERLRATLPETIAYIDAVMAKLDQAQMRRADAELLKREFEYAALMLKHGAKRGLLLLHEPGVNAEVMISELEAVKQAHREMWLARNRPGGWSDSAAHLENGRWLYERQEQ